MNPLLYDYKVDGKEFELISFREFSDQAMKLFNLEHKYVQAISVMLSDHFIADSFDFKFFEEIFKEMGLCKHTLKLDNKSIRILNRINEYIQNNKSDLKKLFGPHIYVQTVRVKNKPDI